MVVIWISLRKPRILYEQGTETGGVQHLGNEQPSTGDRNARTQIKISKAKWKSRFAEIVDESVIINAGTNNRGMKSH